MVTILGVDPGSRITGYGIIKTNGQQHIYLTGGCIVMQEKEFAQRLRKLFIELSKVIDDYRPQHAAIEEVFMAKNANAALKLGQARGAALTAIAMQNLAIAEYSARHIKQAIVGHGGAEKSQVQFMVRLLLKMSDEVMRADAADALAVAICHAHSKRVFEIKAQSIPILTEGVPA